MSIEFRPLPGTLLPIFRAEREGESWFYAPGYLVVTGGDQGERFAEELVCRTPDNSPAAELLRRAETAQREREEIEQQTFAPLCLTLYLNNTCNLACSYCYSQPEAGASPHLELDAIRAAAELVADNCAASRQRMTVVFHGGGEPSVEQSRLERSLDLVEQTALQYGVGLFRYVATNGVMPAEKAAWLARRFDLIGLSCDGPETIQAQQRPLRGGGSSTPAIERTASAVHEADKPLHVRATITPASMPQQSDVAAYICEQLRPQEIHAEPVYRGGLAKAQDCFTAEQAEAFVEAFLEGQETARRYGVRWSNSGSRLAEIHGAYCHVFRNVLNLIPDGKATSCFCISQGERLQQKGLGIGRYEALSQRYSVNKEVVRGLQEKLSRQPEKCRRCFNQYHCTHGCPDLCLAGDLQAEEGEFRCQVNMRLAQATIEACVKELHSRWTGTVQAIGGAVGV